jgi:small subunit ribosomal protein S2
MTRLPGALFVVDIIREHIAIKEAHKLNIPIFAMVDTNSDPREVDYVIPSNDDASKSITKIFENVIPSIQEGLSERNAEKVNSDKQDSTKDKKEDKPKTAKIKVEKVEVKAKSTKDKVEVKEEQEEEE